ncbi:MAG: hypothetical protein GY731_11200, partial [Gammaproteobacteria bacterium]|nr:hypothetical protein [Gammaproteobacteria bacterium]
MNSNLPHPAREESDHSQSAQSGSFTNRISLPYLLRTLGASVLVVSIAIYLFQGWTAGNDIERYLLLLAYTLFLAVAGFISGTWMHESKGARTFVILALGAIPANFAILGALIYSQGSWDTAAAAYPAFVTWRVEHLSSALITAAGSLLVLIPVVWLGFLVLARRSAPAFTALYLASNAAMLIPLRETLAVACLFAGLSAVVWWQVTRSTRQDMSLRTFEGILARAL